MFKLPVKYLKMKKFFLKYFRCNSCFLIKLFDPSSVKNIKLFYVWICDGSWMILLEILLI